MLPEMTPEEFRSLRNQLGLSQGKLARVLGVSVNAVQRWEKDQRGISGPVALAMRLLAEKHAGGVKAA